MKCPLREVGVHDEEGKFYYESADCFEGECAWWDEGSSACAIWSLMSGLDALGKVIREIADKLPIVTRPRK